MKTAELAGNALDWAVAMCEDDKTKGAWTLSRFKPSTDWAAAGPIIERENISITGTNFPWWECDNGWYAHIGDRYAHGSTPLEAAMRCYVASKRGNEIKLPEALTEGNETV